MDLTPQQLTSLATTREVLVETRSGDRRLRTIIWIVVNDDTVYVRSVNGDNGRWYQRALADPRVGIHVGDDEIEFRAVHVDDPAEVEIVTQALRDKYRPGGSLDRMTRSEVLDTTLRLEPVS